MATKKNRESRLIKEAKTLAHSKGLKVSKELIAGGWCITLPNKKNIHARTDADMVKYILNYNTAVI